MCDVAYVLHVEHLERRVHTERVRAAVYGVDAPTLEDARVEFDAVLAAAPVPLTPSELKLRAIGGL